MQKDSSLLPSKHVLLLSPVTAAGWVGIPPTNSRKTKSLLLLLLSLLLGLRMSLDDPLPNLR